MQEIRVLGSDRTPEFRGGVADAASLANLETTRHGLVKPEAGAVCEIGWTLSSEGGPRGVYLRYASNDERPCELIVNGQTALRSAGFEALEAPDWRYQGTVELKPGQNRIALRTQGELPKLEELAVADPPSAPHPSVDVWFAQLREERKRSHGPKPLKLQPARLAGLVDVLRETVTDEGSLALLQRLIHRTIKSTWADSNNGQLRIAWGGPMNGQRFRQRIFGRLMRLGIDVIVETGTYIGASAAFFARQGVPVLSCEVDEGFFATAVAHLCDHRNITLYLSDSRAFLRQLAEDPAFGFELPLFYLDAHWNNDLPLADEIRIIRGRWRQFVIMVDDFEVPAADYGFDSYPDGMELTLGYLERQGVDLTDLAVLFPTVSAELESGARRGTLVLVPAELYEQRMSAERTLYRHRPGGAR